MQIILAPIPVSVLLTPGGVFCRKKRSQKRRPDSGPKMGPWHSPLTNQFVVPEGSPNRRFRTYRGPENGHQNRDRFFVKKHMPRGVFHMRSNAPFLESTHSARLCRGNASGTPTQVPHSDAMHNQPCPRRGANKHPEEALRLLVTGHSQTDARVIMVPPRQACLHQCCVVVIAKHAPCQCIC